MPTLNGIGKDAVVNHHLPVPSHLLRGVPELACGEPTEGNLIVQGDNLVALKALLPGDAGRVKCIYIDPPYSTGNEGRAYNDNVNSVAIRGWLGKVVGKEGETLDRHDRGLYMKYPRLALLRQFLREDERSSSVSTTLKRIGFGVCSMRFLAAEFRRTVSVGQDSQERREAILHSPRIRSGLCRLAANAEERKAVSREQKPRATQIIDEWRKLKKKHGDKTGGVLVVEFKGADRATNDDTREKERLGDVGRTKRREGFVSYN
jgi:hypothetical protein